MPDEPTGNNASTDLSALVSERDKLRDELGGAKARIKELNGESAGHRLNAERLGKLADERAALIEAARAETASAVEAVRTEGVTALDSLRADLTGKLTAAEKTAAERIAASRERVTNADLRIAAKDAGMVDLDGLKLLDSSTLKVGDDGGVTNATEVLGALKQSKPWAFGQTSTSVPATAPLPDPGKAKNYNDMAPAEQTEWKRANGLRL